MADLNKIAKALRLFNEKADKLTRLSFMDKMRHPDSGITISFKNLNEPGGGTVRQERRGPEEEAIDAFVLTFRYFIQNNEQTSFGNMEKFYLDAPIDPNLQQEFAKLRRDVNEYLDEMTNITFNNEAVTRRRLMEVFVYGGFSHANEEKRRLHKTWMNDPFVAVMFENEFLTIMANIHIAITYIKTLNEKTLEHLPGPS